MAVAVTGTYANDSRRDGVMHHKKKRGSGACRALRMSAHALFHLVEPGLVDVCPIRPKVGSMEIPRLYRQ